MRRAVLLLALLGGCDKLFGLDHVDLNNPTGGDGGTATQDVIRGPDAAPVTCPVDPWVFDEDGDSLDDRCDACPTRASDGSDVDGDGLPNACDPNLVAIGDTILFAATFYDPIDLTAFDHMGVSWSAADKGTVALAASASLRTALTYPASQIEIRTSGIVSSSLTGALTYGTSTTTCTVLGSNCAKTAATSTCVKTGSLQSETDSVSSNVRTVWLTHAAELQFPLTTCKVELNGAGPIEATSQSPIGEAQLLVSTNADATTVIQSIVVYGAKN